MYGIGTAEVELYAAAQLLLDRTAQRCHEALADSVADFTPAYDAIEANLGTLVVNPEQDPNHPAVLATNGEHGLVLLGPDGRTKRLPYEPLTSAMSAVDSPLRTRIATETLDTFAFVLVVPGDDEQENARARAAAATAQQQLSALAPHLPRPVANPLTVIELTKEQVSSEDVLLWTLGVDDTTQASMVVLYGRGRRAGPPIRENFEDTELATQLALIGESCECETDRAWLMEPVALMRSQLPSSNIADKLGFDPSSPMVKAEIRRILARGDFGSGRPKSGEGDGRRPKDLAEIVFGYSERSLDDRFGTDAPSNAPTEPADSATPAENPVSRVQVQLARDDGWDFPDEPAATEILTESSSASVNTEKPTSLMPYAWAIAIVVLASGGAAWIILRR